MEIDCNSINVDFLIEKSTTHPYSYGGLDHFGIAIIQVFAKNNFCVESQYCSTSRD